MKIFKFLLLTVFLFSFSCVNTNNQSDTLTTTQDTDATASLQSYTINASETWKYLHLENGLEIDISTNEKLKGKVDAMSRATITTWDIAFFGQKLKTNSGESSTGGAAGTYITDAQDIEDITQIPEYYSVITDKVMTIYDYSLKQEVSESLNPLLNGCDYDSTCDYLAWYAMEKDTLFPRKIAYIVRAANGGFYKFQIISYIDKVYTIEVEKME